MTQDAPADSAVVGEQPATATATPSTTVPEPRSFWCAGADLATLRPPAPTQALPALERLGPSPFPKSRFRFLSFLATVYDHVATRVDPHVDQTGT